MIPQIVFSQGFGVIFHFINSKLLNFFIKITSLLDSLLDQQEARKASNKTAWTKIEYSLQVEYVCRQKQL